MPEKHKHLVLLAAMLALLLTQPFLAHASTAARVAYDLLAAAATLAVLLVVFSERWERWLGLVMAAPAVVLVLAVDVAAASQLPAIAVAYHFSAVLFFGFAVGVIVRDIFRRRAMAFDEILGAFAGYLMLGIVWGHLYVLIELAAPGSFAVSPDIRWQLDNLHLRRALFIYVSFATMASLGYSDVTAIAPLANVLTWLEAMSAQFYLAVVIAQIVGMKIAQVAGGGRSRP